MRLRADPAPEPPGVAGGRSPYSFFCICDTSQIWANGAGSPNKKPGERDIGGTIVRKWNVRGGSTYLELTPAITDRFGLDAENLGKLCDINLSGMVSHRSRAIGIRKV